MSDNELPDPPVPMDALRAASMATLIGSTMTAFAEGIKTQVKIQEAERRLIVMTRPAHLDEVFAEVDRRAKVYAKAWRERPEPAPTGEAPRYAALCTVAEDVAYGRLG